MSSLEQQTIPCETAAASPEERAWTELVERLVHDLFVEPLPDAAAPAVVLPPLAEQTFAAPLAAASGAAMVACAADAQHATDATDATTTASCDAALEAATDPHVAEPVPADPQAHEAGPEVAPSPTDQPAAEAPQSAPQPAPPPPRAAADAAVLERIAHIESSLLDRSDRGPQASPELDAIVHSIQELGLRCARIESLAQDLADRAAPPASDLDSDEAQDAPALPSTTRQDHRPLPAARTLSLVVLPVVLGWTFLLWQRTQSAALAAGCLAVATVVGCTLLLRARPVADDGDRPAEFGS